MTTDPITSTRRHRRLRGDEGSSLVEFALIMSILFLLIFGIISFGLILSFQQDLTRSAAEGARAGAVAFPAANAHTDAQTATEQSITAIGKQCNDLPGAMKCDEWLHDCSYTGPTWPQTNKNADPADDCIRVVITYDYEHFPLVAKPPIISQFLPDTLVATSDARVNT